MNPATLTAIKTVLEADSEVSPQQLALILGTTAQTCTKRGADELNTFGLPMMPCPIWASAKNVAALFSIPQGWLGELVDDGIVRRKKHNRTVRQSGATYCVADLIEYLNSDTELSTT